MTVRASRVLFWMMAVATAIAGVGSILFRAGRFDQFPYAWF
jgi:hypothetical protein